MNKPIPFKPSNSSQRPAKLEIADYIRRELMKLEDEALKAGLIHSAILIEQAQYSISRETLSERIIASKTKD